MASGDAFPNPLAQPRERDLLDRFLAHGKVRSEGGHRAQLAGLCSAFAAIPYENLTKIVKYAACRLPAAARRPPQEVIADYQRFHAGGTCFSLTAALLYLVRAWGFQGAPILADRHYGANTHCALIVWMEGQPHLLDPGYLIVDPIPLPSQGTPVVVPTRFNQLELVRSDDRRVDLHTICQGNRRYRLTFKNDPVDDRAFLQAWDASFDWEMMHYPVLTRVTEHEQLYLRGTHFQKRTQTTIEREVIPEQQLSSRIVQEFGISHDIVQQALDVLRPPG